MKTPATTWESMLKLRGSHGAREHLRWVSRPLMMKQVAPRRRDPLTVLHDLVHNWTGTPAENRLRFATAVRELIRKSRDDRERIMGYCAPGVARTRLP